MSKYLLIFLLLTSGSVLAQQEIIQLYTGKAPGSENWNWQEKTSMKNIIKHPPVYDVIAPSLTTYMPDSAIANGTSVIVCPGGGFQFLSIESEGTMLAEWLVKKGITVFILKYRLIHTKGPDPAVELMGKLGNMDNFVRSIDSVVTMDIADAKKAIEYVRDHAAEYKIKPDKIGLMGFSAGGTVTMGVAYSYTSRNRPDFLAPVYAFLKPLTNTEVPKDAPPMFICVASDDDLGLAIPNADLYKSWKTAGKNAELHLYSKGGHGFGMEKQNLPVDGWIDRFGDWLFVQGFLTK